MPTATLPTVLHSVDEVAWDQLEHNYGSARDVPGLLGLVRDSRPEIAGKALVDLEKVLFHQGGWVCPAASAALPFLLQLAADPAVHHRAAVIEVVALLAGTAVEIAPRWVHQGWPAAWVAVRPAVFALLTDNDPDVRRAAGYLVGCGGIPAEHGVPALVGRWSVEPEDVVRLDLVLSVGRLAAAEPHELSSIDAVNWLHGLLRGDLQERLAAVHALSGVEPRLPEQHLHTLVTALRAEDVARWHESDWLGGGPRSLVRQTGDLFGDDPHARARLVTRLLAESPGPALRVAALAEAAHVLSRWISPTSALVPVLADHLDDPRPEVRLPAVHLLAALGPAANGYADEIAALTGDTATGTDRSDSTVGDAAVWALARLRDERCLPGLLDRLTGNRLGFGLAPAYSSSRLYQLSLPDVREVLAPLEDHLDTLLPAIRGLLSGRPRLAVALCRTLVGWGRLAAPATPELVELLDGDIWRWAAEALGAIGPAAAGAQPQLARLAADESLPLPDRAVAALAQWQVDGDPELALRVLVAALRTPPGPRGLDHRAARMLGELGSLAGEHAGLLRELMLGARDWGLVETTYAYWRVTDDPNPAALALTEVIQPFARGRFLPVMLPAIRYLGEVGPAAAGVAPVLRDAVARDDRLGCSGGWRGFSEDEQVRAAVTDGLPHWEPGHPPSLL